VNHRLAVPSAAQHAACFGFSHFRAKESLAEVAGGEIKIILGAYCYLFSNFQQHQQSTDLFDVVIVTGNIKFLTTNTLKLQEISHRFCSHVMKHDRTACKPSWHVMKEILLLL